MPSSSLHLFANPLAKTLSAKIALCAARGVSFPEAPTVRDELLDMGAIIRPIPPNHMSLRPPLVTTDDQIDKIVSFLREVLAQSSVRNGG